MDPIRTLQPARPGPRGVVIELPGVPGLQNLGTATDSFECPACHALLLDHVDERKLARLIFRCPSCGGHSTIAPRRLS